MHQGCRSRRRQLSDTGDRGQESVLLGEELREPGRLLRDDGHSPAFPHRLRHIREETGQASGMAGRRSEAHDMSAAFLTPRLQGQSPFKPAYPRRQLRPGKVGGRETRRQVTLCDQGSRQLVRLVVQVHQGRLDQVRLVHNDQSFVRPVV